MNAVIADFVQEYRSKTWIYAQNAAATARICDKVLQAESVPGVVTHRVKNPSSLERKLCGRERCFGRRYPSKKDIQDEISDLAGVRIVVCFPHDRERVQNALGERFDIELTKHYGEVDTNSIVRPGYCATHCWVYLRENESQARDDRQRRRIEIQIVSMLRHAWAQFEHDAVYKAQSQMNPEDRQVLHSLSRAINCGESFLNSISESRAVCDIPSDVVFEMVYEVGCWVADVAKQENQLQGTSIPLEEFLRILKMARPIHLSCSIKSRL
ncbi:hypothetical protein BDV26DRAFT_302045 [Aspergillus bertholletiae]|uniref:RelA/SpoT domain-containing protein n=1 Tax=Aspergillus bertholletiae TaxID=1226010 RepID=A0A5N7AR37_9EURO|nr:hypothetical protein BDV26DRAFT_302045 [Aspergillus bertholletiae]